MPGEIRMQWWMDIIKNTAIPSGDPVANALQQVIVEYLSINGGVLIKEDNFGYLFYFSEEPSDNNYKWIINNFVKLEKYYHEEDSRFVKWLKSHFPN